MAENLKLDKVIEFDGALYDIEATRADHAITADNYSEDGKIAEQFSSIEAHLQSNHIIPTVIAEARTSNGTVIDSSYRKVASKITISNILLSKITKNSANTIEKITITQFKGENFVQKFEFDSAKLKELSGGSGSLYDRINNRAIDTAIPLSDIEIDLDDGSTNYFRVELTYHVMTSGGTGEYKEYQTTVNTEAFPVVSPIIRRGDFFLGTSTPVTGVYHSRLDNAFFALNKRFAVTPKVYSKQNETWVEDKGKVYTPDEISVLFDNGYENSNNSSNNLSFKLPAKQKLVLNINFKLDWVYFYGMLFSSFYSGKVPASVACRFYHRSGTSNYTWTDFLSFSPVDGSSRTSWLFNNIPGTSAYAGIYNVQQLEIEVIASDQECNFTCLEFWNTRALPKDSPIVTKFNPEVLYYPLSAPEFIENGKSLKETYLPILANTDNVEEYGEVVIAGTSNIQGILPSEENFDKIVPNAHILLKQATTKEWSENNYIPLVGEPIYYTDTQTLKVGDGVSTPDQLKKLNAENNHAHEIKAVLDTEGVLSFELGNVTTISPEGVENTDLKSY